MSHVYRNGAWREVEEGYVFRNGAWRRILSSYVYTSGAWRLVPTADDPTGGVGVTFTPPDLSRDFTNPFGSTVSIGTGGGGEDNLVLGGVTVGLVNITAVITSRSSTNIGWRRTEVGSSRVNFADGTTTASLTGLTASNFNDGVNFVIECNSARRGDVFNFTVAYTITDNSGSVTILRDSTIRYLN